MLVLSGLVFGEIRGRDHALEISVTVGLVASWLWIAWVSNKGRSWVRVAATVLGVLSIVVGLFVIVFGDLWPVRLVMIAPVTVAVVVLVLLERPESRR